MTEKKLVRVFGLINSISLFVIVLIQLGCIVLIFDFGLKMGYVYTPMDGFSIIATVATIGFAYYQYLINQSFLKMEKDRTLDSKYDKELGDLRYSLENLYGPLKNMLQFSEPKLSDDEKTWDMRFNTEKQSIGYYQNIDT